MKNTKIVLGSCVVCVIGAIGLDIGLKTTASMLIIIGFLGITFGPFLISLDDKD